jgi:hypothetical protein
MLIYHAAGGLFFDSVRVLWSSRFLPRSSSTVQARWMVERGYLIMDGWVFNLIAEPLPTSA